MEEKQQLIERWDGFILKIKSRCDELISQANQGTEMFIPHLLFDTNAIGNAWTGIKSQIYELSNKLNEGWEKMDSLYDNADSTREETDLQRAKKEDTEAYIQWEYEQNYILAMAKAARQVLFSVKNHINESKMHNCTQCGSNLEINIYSFRPKNIKCASCGSVNTYKPDDRVVSLESWVLPPLANEISLNEKKAECFLEEKYRHTANNNKSSTLKGELINSKKATVKKYYQFLIDSIPEKAEFYIRQRDERLKWAENIR